MQVSRRAASALVVTTAVASAGFSVASASTTAAEPGWSSIAAVTRHGQVVTITPDGTANTPLALDGVDGTDTTPMWSIGAAASTRVLMSSDDGQHVVFDAATGESRAVAAPSFTTAASAVDGDPAAALLLPTLTGSDAGVLVDLTDGSTVPVEMAPPDSSPHFGAIGTSDGAAVAITDINADRTHIIADGVVQAVVPGVVVAVGDGWVATGLTTADETTVSFFDLDGALLSSSTPLAGDWALADGQDGTVLAVGDGGELVAIRPDGFADEPATVDTTGGSPREAFTTLGGDRLVVLGTAGAEIFDRGGARTGTIAGRVDSVLSWPRSAARCITLSAIGGTSVDVVVIDTETGAVLTTDRHPYAPVSDDGCTFRQSGGDGVTIVHDGEPIVLAGATSLVGLSADGRTALVQDTPTSYRIVDLDSPGAAAIAVTTTEWLTGAAFVTLP